jgi:hypothetical protein
MWTCSGPKHVIAIVIEKYWTVKTLKIMQDIDHTTFHLLKLNMQCLPRHDLYASGTNLVAIIIIIIMIIIIIITTN